MILARAPYRISLGGGGTDLPSYYERYGGFVVSAAIDKYLYVGVNRPAADNLIRLKYSKYEEVATVADIQHDLVRPALELLNLEDSLEIVSMADAPAGTGLGSSGSYLVALLTALYELKRERVPIQELAEQATYIECELAGHPVGKQDHYLAAFGGLTCLDIDRAGRVTVSALKMSVGALEALRDNTLLYYTGMIRGSGDILGCQKRDTERAQNGVTESLHRTKELGYRIREALEADNLDGFGSLLNEHWQNKKQRSSQISCTQIDKWYEAALSHGALGGKIIGAGGGGFFLFYCPREHKARVREVMTAEGLREMTYRVDFDGAKVLVNL